MHSLSGKPVLLLDCPHEENTFPYGLFDPLLFPHMPSVSHPVTTCHSVNLSSVLMTSL